MSMLNSEVKVSEGNIDRSEMYRLAGFSPVEIMGNLYDQVITNYTFAMGIYMLVNSRLCNDVGNVRGISLFKYTRENVVSEICKDLDVLNYNYSFFSHHHEIDKKANNVEFILDVLYCEPNENTKRGAFCLARYDPTNKIWILKPSKKVKPTICSNSTSIYMGDFGPLYYLENKEKEEIWTNVYTSIGYIVVTKKSQIEKFKKIMKSFASWLLGKN